MSTKNDIPQNDGSGDGDAVTKPESYDPYGMCSSKMFS